MSHILMRFLSDVGHKTHSIAGHFQSAEVPQMSEWRKTNYPGVRFREHPTRKHKNKPDQYFTIRYRKNGKLKEEPLGWASEGWTPAQANAALVDRKRGNENQVLEAKKKPDRAPDSPAQETKPEEPVTVPFPAVQKSITFKAAADLFVEWAKANKKTE